MQTSTSALRASALVTRWCSRATSYATASKWVVSVWSAPFVSTANADRVEAQCPTTSILPGGQITTQGTIVNRSLNFTLPITGGSGRYQGAGGQVVSRDVSTPTQPQVELTFQLEF